MFKSVLWMLVTKRIPLCPNVIDDIIIQSTHKDTYADVLSIFSYTIQKSNGRN